MGGCVKNRHCLNRGRHLQKKSRHWTCYILAVGLLCACYGLAASRHEAGFIFCAKESPVAAQTKSGNIFENLFRKFLSIGSLAGKYWNKTSLPCKKCADAPIIRREKWQTHKVDRTNNSFIQLRVFFSRIHKKSAYRHYVGTPIYDNLEAEYGALRLSHTNKKKCDNRAAQHSIPWMSYSIEVGIVHPELQSKRTLPK